MEEQQEPTLLDIFAGIALPGVIGKSSYSCSDKDIAIQAYDIAEAMIKESLLRQPKSEEECTQE
jgi:hypothetical protein